MASKLYITLVAELVVVEAAAAAAVLVGAAAVVVGSAVVVAGSAAVVAGTAAVVVGTAAVVEETSEAIEVTPAAVATELAMSEADVVEARGATPVALVASDEATAAPEAVLVASVLVNAEFDCAPTPAPPALVAVLLTTETVEAGSVTADCEVGEDDPDKLRLVMLELEYGAVFEPAPVPAPPEGVTVAVIVAVDVTGTVTVAVLVKTTVDV